MIPDQFPLAQLGKPGRQLDLSRMVCMLQSDGPISSRTLMEVIMTTEPGKIVKHYVIYRRIADRQLV